MAYFTDLPPELLIRLYKFLKPEDISRMSKVCKSFNEVAKVESIWEQKCRILLNGPVPLRTDGLNYRLIYTKLFYKYWDLLGFWGKDAHPYSGLIHVKFDIENACIIGTEWLPPIKRNILEPTYPSHVFSLEVSQKTGKLVQRCRLSTSTSKNSPTFPTLMDLQKHSCNVEFMRKKGEPLLEFRCGCAHKDHGPPIDIMFDEDDQFGEYFNIQVKLQRMRKFSCFLSHLNMYKYVRLERPLFPPANRIIDAIIQPGLFKGDYNVHGVEFVLLTYETDMRVEAIKITGDSNIPARHVTFKADLSKALVLTRQDQGSLSSLKAAQVLEPMVPLNQLPVQPFVNPDSIHSTNIPIPDYCKARFLGLGQIAFDGYQNSRYLPGHWVIFNEDLFGFIWFELKSMNLFHRVQENFDMNHEICVKRKEVIL